MLGKSIRCRERASGAGKEHQVQGKSIRCREGASVAANDGDRPLYLRRLELTQALRKAQTAE